MNWRSDSVLPSSRFTEPSVEVDVTCFKCGGEGCPLYVKAPAGIEVLGAGMVHPNVLKMSGI
jgi:phenylalanyl-tRNA synthetase alpha chain